MKTIWYYVRTRNSAGKLVRDHFRTRSKKRADLYIKMFSDSVIEVVHEGEKKEIWTAT